MKYESGAKFRAALEEHIRSVSFGTGEAQIRLRKLAAMERFLARLADGQPASWQLKGGLALQIRSSNRFQTSEDLDMLVFVRGDQVIQFIEQTGARDVGDWFSFEIETSGSAGSLIETGQGRFTIRAVLAGHDFETFHLDVSVGEKGFWPAEPFPMASLFGFADLAAILAPCSGLEWQAAEKFYTYTHPQDHRIFSKLENLIDLLTIASLGEMNGMELYQAIEASFRFHRAGPIPGRLPEPPASRERSFNRMAVEAGLAITDLPTAYEALKGYLEPILSGTQAGKWDPLEWKWSAPFVTSL
jgi:hypothetical protein